MRTSLKILLFILLLNCSNTIDFKKKLPVINLVVNQNKYSLILKRQFHRNLNEFNDSLGKITIKTKLSFRKNKALSNKGNDNLNIITGKLDYKIFYSLNSKVDVGSISSSVNTGSVTSLYGIDESNNFAKERISKHLASKLYRLMLLSIKSSEN